MKQLTVLSYVCDGRMPLRPFLPSLIERALAEGVDVISAQGNGMDAGPWYLGAGETLPPHRYDLEPAILGAKRAGIPFVLSLGGRAGADAHVAPYLDLVDTVASDAGIELRTWFVRGEVDREYLRSQLASGVKFPRLADSPRLSEFLSVAELDEAVVLQGQMGPEPLMAGLEAFERGEVDGVLAGRALDLGVHMAYPLLKGFPIAGAAHMAKVIECGALCCEPPDPFSAVTATLFEDGSFTVTPVDPSYRCTIRSVATHSFYERENPAEERNPGGVLDLSNAHYEQVDERSVRCSGAIWRPEPYTVKIEGVKSLGYETALVAIVRDPLLIDDIDEYVRTQLEVGKRRVLESGVVESESSFEAIVHTVGSSDGGATSSELTLIMRVVAASPQLSVKIANTIRSSLTHANYPGRMTTAGNLAFPFSQAFMQLGEAFVFNVWHLLPLDDPLEPFAASRIDFPRGDTLVTSAPVATSGSAAHETEV